MDELIAQIAVQHGPDGLLMLLVWWELRKLAGTVTRVLDRQEEVLVRVRSLVD